MLNNAKNQKRPLLLFPRKTFMGCLAAALLAGHAGATGVQELRLSPVPPAPPKLTIDGKLDDWRSITGFTQDPLGSLINAGGDPAVEAILNDPPSVTFKTCYDSDALYVAVEWKDRKPGVNTTAAGDAAHWPEGGEGFELHLLTDRVLHLACWPTAGGLAVMARYDGQKTWKDVSGSVKATGAAGTDGKTYAQELRIPWAVITATGKLPADGKLELGIDFAWNAIPPSFVENLHKTTWADEAETRGGKTVSFLTARPNLISSGYIPSPGDWGTLVFGAAPADDLAAKASDGNTSLSSLPVATAKSPPAVDGSLDGWDESLFQTATCLGALWGDRFTCRVAAQSDADNLYLAAHFATPGPVNWMSESTQQGYNGGDAFQVRLSNGTNKVNLCGWYDSRAGAPALTADGNDLPSPFLLKQGAREGFKPDGQGGYVQTLALPWKLLLGGTPKAGSAIKATLQFWFNDFSNRYSTYAQTTLEKRPALSVAYKMPADGQLTLGLCDRDGRLLKWLAQDDYRYAGENKEAWDGLDQWGNPVPAGSYSLKGLYHAPISTEYKMTIGNPGNPPWPTPDGKGDWLGDESDPQAAVTDGKWVFLAAPDAEDGFWLIAVDENGQRQWGVAQSPSNSRCVSLAIDSNYLYALYSGPLNKASRFKSKSDAIGRAVLICYDKRTGKTARFSTSTPRLQVATWPYREDIHWLDDLRNQKSFSPATFGGQPRYACTDVGETTNALGVAAAGGKVYISLFYDDKLVELDATTGQPTGLEIPIDAPAGLCALDDHNLLAVSGRQVMKVNLNAKTASPFITTGLAAPFGVTAGKDGNVYVSDWGSSFQVKAFDPTGKFLHAIGKEGGRPWVGKWDANGMLVPRGLAVTDAGKLWVAEDDGSPSRVSVWDTKSGSFLRDYIGPTPYGGGTFFAIDPKDPTLAHAEGATFKLDYEKKTYTPLAIDYRRQNRDDPFTPNGHGTAWGHTEIRYHGGHEYLVANVSGWMFSILQRQGDVYRAVAAFGGVGRGPDPTAMDAFDSDLGHHAYPGFFPDWFASHAGNAYSWTDTNGDNLVQPDEMRWGTQPFGGFWGGFTLAPDWSIYTMGNVKGKTAFFHIPLKGWTPAGAPIYDVSDATQIGLDIHGSDANIESLYVTKDNKLIVCYDYQGGKNPDSVGCYGLDGHCLWTISRPPKPWIEPTRFQERYVHAQSAVYDFDIPNLGDVFGTWAWHGAARPYLITTDGLYVGTVGEYTRLGPKALWGESYTYYYQAPDGTPYWINGASQADNILQIKGLEAGSTGRFAGTYQLSDSDVKLAAAMQEVPEVKLPPKPVLAVTWLDKPPVIDGDGDLSDWNMNEGVTLDNGTGKTAEVALGRDAHNLYLAYRVHEANPMRNGGSDWQTLFTTGDCADLMLQSDSKADPNRHGAGAGDERLLFSMFQGKPVAMLYRPVVPGTASPVRLSTVSFDQIVQLDSAKVSMKRDSAHNFYTVEASVPLTDLGLDPKQTENLRGDVGVIFADESGRSRSLRLYYYNHRTQMINDLPTEAALQPAEWGQILMPLGKNLLQNGGFENPFVDSKSDVDKGWYVEQAVNGAGAAISDESPYSGHHSLLLESAPMANGGKGGGYVVVGQRVAVTAGHQYSLRFQFRSQDFPAAHSAGARGAAGFGARIDWDCPPPNHGAVTYVADSYSVAGPRPIADWFTFFDVNRATIAPPAPYTAPVGALAAGIVFHAQNTMDAWPKFFFDDVEFVDVTPGADSVHPGQ